MKCTIECSYGEIIDKITILKIKLENVQNSEQQKNISNEYESLKKWIKNDDKIFEQYFNDLYKVNKKLWDLEDNIREKSKKKEFDKKYIEYAEQIHITNDERYSIKNKMNNTYHSHIKEEKLYNSKNNSSVKEKNNIKIIQSDVFLFECAINKYNDGAFIESFNILEKLCEKYVDAEPCVSIINIFFCMSTACMSLGKDNIYEYKLNEFIDIVDEVIKNNETMLIHLKKQYAHLLLKNKNYTESKKYAKYINHVVNKTVNADIHYDTMDYFKEDDKDKILLIYTSGGIGDKIMYSRFVKKVCETNKDNKIIFLIDDNLFWIYNHVYKDIENIRLVKHSNFGSILYFDYHINVNMLMYYLNLTYETIYYDRYLINLPESHISLDGIIEPSKMNVVINWHGNYQNICEKYNRGMDLKNMITLFENESLKNINWISVQKEVNNEEREIFKKYNVKNLCEIIDNGSDSFKDTITILKHVDLVISTDTSLVHIACTMDVQCWAMLAVGCEWRWSRDKCCSWYPNLKMIRQKTPGNWSNVMKTVLSALIILEKKRTVDNS